MSSTKSEFVPDFSADFGTTDAVHDFSPLIRVYENGRVERLMGEEVVPASDDHVTGVRSNDVDIPLRNGVSARLYVPKTTIPSQKLPLVVYNHGGGFVAGTAFLPVYNNYLNLLVAEANIVVVSVNYRRPTEHPLPIAYEDSWAAIKWVASNSHSIGEGQEVWLKDHADFQNVFFAGDSAGGNIAHNMALRAGLESLDGIKLVGTVLMQPYFWGEKPIGGAPSGINERRFLAELWRFANPSTSGSDDPLMNPALDPNLKRLGGSRVPVCVAEQDKLRDRGYYYLEALGKSG